MQPNPAKKLRGVPRRLRALKRWSEGFAGDFPSRETLALTNRYYNWKIPVDANLVEGRQATRDIQRTCAQRLIDACGHLLADKPEFARETRVTCVVCLPDMFISEVCIYLDEAYYRGHITGGRIVGRRLSAEWGLELPEGVDELGVEVDDGGERWYFGEVG